jgi:hypothetical protein
MRDFVNQSCHAVNALNLVPPVSMDEGTRYSATCRLYADPADLALLGSQ